MVAEQAGSTKGQLGGLDQWLARIVAKGNFCGLESLQHQGAI